MIVLVEGLDFQAFDSVEEMIVDCEEIDVARSMYRAFEDTGNEILLAVRIENGRRAICAARSPTNRKEWLVSMLERYFEVAGEQCDSKIVEFYRLLRVK